MLEGKAEKKKGGQNKIWIIISGGDRPLKKELKPLQLLALKQLIIIISNNVNLWRVFITSTK